MKSKFSLNVSKNPLQFIKFSDGTIQLKVDEELLHNLLLNIDSVSNIEVEAFIKCSDGILALAQIKAFLDNYLLNNRREKKFSLLLPYVPYARYDRAMFKNDVFSLKVFTTILNSLNFNEVIICDPHSSMASSLINNVSLLSSTTSDFYTQSFLIDTLFKYKRISASKYNCIISPDMGAAKKSIDCAAVLGIDEVIKCDKTRNVKTGEILETVIYGDVTNKHVLIVDDIADGGYTFIQLAKLLKEKGALTVDLYVTHGIFSKGFNDLLVNIDNIYTYFLWSDSELVVPEEVTFLHSF